VLELPVGAIRESGTQVNDQLALQDPGTNHNDVQDGGGARA